MTDNHKELIEHWGDKLSDNQHSILKPYYFARICNYSVSMRNESYLSYANKRMLIEVNFQHPEYDTTIKLYV